MYGYDTNFAGVLIITGDEGNRFLRSIEQADHRTFGSTSTNPDISPSEVASRMKRLRDWVDTQIIEFTKVLKNSPRAKSKSF